MPHQNDIIHIIIVYTKIKELIQTVFVLLISALEDAATIDN